MQSCTSLNEEARLGALQAFEVLDTAPEEAFDRITRLAKTVLQVPIVLVSLIDRDRQWFKSRQGLDATETPRDISFCTRAIEQDVPLIVPDALLDPRFAENPFVVGGPKIRFYVGVQLRNHDGFNVGTLCCVDTKPRVMSENHIAVLQDFARLVVDELELRLLASTDGLTGSMTRRAFMEASQRDLSLARRHGRDLSCLMIDADHFKTVNDVHGHAAGDDVLRRLVTVCKSQLRRSDYVGRLGGEEFAILLRETRVEGAVEFADRLRLLVADQVFTTQRGSFNITVSVGVAGLDVGVIGIDDLLSKADAALYRAKACGRNRTVLLNPTRFLSMTF